MLTGLWCPQLCPEFPSWTDSKLGGFGPCQCFVLSFYSTVCDVCPWGESQSWWFSLLFWWFGVGIFFLSGWCSLTEQWCHRWEYFQHVLCRPGWRADNWVWPSSGAWWHRAAAVISHCGRSGFGSAKAVSYVKVQELNPPQSLWWWEAAGWRDCSFFFYCVSLCCHWQVCFCWLTSN